MSNFGSKIKFGQLKKIIQIFIYYFLSFKVLNISLVDQNRNVYILSRKNSKDELHPSNIFWIVVWFKLCDVS